MAATNMPPSTSSSSGKSRRLALGPSSSSCGCCSTRGILAMYVLMLLAAAACGQAQAKQDIHIAAHPSAAFQASLSSSSSSSIRPSSSTSSIPSSSANTYSQASQLRNQLRQQQQQHQQQAYVQLLRRSLIADASSSAAAADTAAMASAANAPAMPVYGNWCGPNYGSGIPIDELDECCRVHDLCYDNTVYNHCNCDQSLVRCLNKVSTIQSYEFRKRATRAAIVTYFDNTACRCSAGADICMPVKKCFCLADG